MRYLYNVLGDSEAPVDNEIRQLMAARVVAALASTDTNWLPLHERNLRYVAGWYRSDSNGSAWVEYNSIAKLGATAMMIRLYVASPLFPSLERRALRLANRIRLAVNRDSSIEPIFNRLLVESERERYLLFYSGEAILSLLELGDKSQHCEWCIRVARSLQDHYLRKYVGSIASQFFPQMVPWHTMTLHRLMVKTGDKQYKAAIYALNDHLLDIQDTITGVFFRPTNPASYGVPHAASDAVYTEGLSYALETAAADGDRVRACAYIAGIAKSVSNLNSLQIGPAASRRVADPKKALGGIRVARGSPWIRVDNVQHAIDAFEHLLIVVHRWKSFLARCDTRKLG